MNAENACANMQETFLSGSAGMPEETEFPDDFSACCDKAEKGLAKFREEHRDQPNTDIVRCVKRSLFEDKNFSEGAALNTLVATLKTIVEICGLTTEEYDRFWSVAMNKKMCLENLSRKITALANDADKEECAFQRKRLLFKMAYPEYYEKNFSKITPENLFFVEGKDRADLVRAAKPSLEEDGPENSSAVSGGAIVDRLMMTAINAAFKKARITSRRQIMKILVDKNRIKTLWRPASSQKSAIPGCFLVINARECYESILDFYFLNLPKEEQLAYVDDYMKIRRDAGMAPIPLLDALYRIFQDIREIR